MTLTESFIEQQLPPPPARVLDAGCGDGTLARAMLARGYEVTAIDIDPQRADDVVRCADICTFGITDIDRTRALLRPGGRLIVDEFAHERADDRIADLFFAEPNSLLRWREHHGDYHTGEAISGTIAARFDVALTLADPGRRDRTAPRVSAQVCWPTWAPAPHSQANPYRCWSKPPSTPCDVRPT
jgi:hypothetical protein